MFNKGADGVDMYGKIYVNSNGEFIIKKQVLLEKYPTLFFFCENLVDFNKAHLHDATLNLDMHAKIFSHLSISSVDGKQQLSESV